jgi:hypothetical protein
MDSMYSTDACLLLVRNKKCDPEPAHCSLARGMCSINTQKSHPRFCSTPTSFRHRGCFRPLACGIWGKMMGVIPHEGIGERWALLNHHVAAAADFETVDSHFKRNPCFRRVFLNIASRRKWAFSRSVSVRSSPGSAPLQPIPTFASAVFSVYPKPIGSARRSFTIPR